MFVLTVGYVDMTTYIPTTKYYYIIDGVYVIHRMFVLFISTLSFLLLLHTASWRYKRDYHHTSIDILFYIMFYIIKTLLYHVRSCNKIGPDLNLLPQSTVNTYAPVKTMLPYLIKFNCCIYSYIWKYSFLFSTFDGYWG